LIPPGKKGKVTLKVRTKGYQGNIVKGATVISNDPKTPKRFLRISAQVKPLIRCSPTPYIALSKTYGKEMTRTIAVSSPVEPGFRIDKVESFVPNVTAEIIKSWKEKDGMHYNIKVVFGKKMKIGPYHGFIRLFTNLKKAPTYDLRISGMVEGPIKVMPRRSSVFSDPEIAGGMAATGFSIYGNQPGLKIKKVTSTIKQLVTRLITVEDGKKYYLAVIWPGGNAERNPYSGKIQVYTNNDVQPVIEIPFSIYARRVTRPKSSPPPTARPPVVKKGGMK